MKRLNLTILFLTLLVVSAFSQDTVKLVILHTNDTHSQVEPTEISTLNSSNMGGYARRMGVIDKIRSEEENVLLFDDGDFSQGTPYFNFFNGRVEIEAMNRMKYDAATLGNHEFDNGLDTLAVVLEGAKFPIVCSNYDLENTPMKGMLKPYLIVEKSGLKIGILGLGVNPESLIIANNYKGLVYLDPLEKANEVSEFLKLNEACDLVICLSHLGASTKEGVVSDYFIAKNSKYIDVILGGHSHDMIENEFVENELGAKVCIAQMGKKGLYMGRIDIEFEKH